MFTYSLHHLDITLYDLKTSKDLWYQVMIYWRSLKIYEKTTVEHWEDYKYAEERPIEGHG